MSNSLRTVLIGIVLILASLFLMGVCILSRPGGSGPEGLALALFASGAAVSAAGLFFVKD